jgi:hypothetical protein
MSEANDSFSITTNEGWLSRIGKSFSGLLIGPLLIIAAIVLLWWNEGRNAHTLSALTEGKKNVIATPAEEVVPSNNGKLVYLTGMATTDEVLEDEQFGVSQNALLLRRVAKTYQWKESEKSEAKSNVGGSETTTKTYSYTKEWSERLIDSREFHKKEGHSNPTSLSVTSDAFIAENAHVGAFTLTPQLIEKLQDEKQLRLQEEDLEAADGGDELQLYNGGFYLGDKPKDPQIGDVMITYSYVEPSTISVVAAQQASTLVPYSAQNGTTIALLEKGTRSADDLFATALSENSMLTWLIRLGGCILSFIGFAAIMKPLVIIADVLPILGSIVGAGTGFISFILGLVVSLVTIAIAWIAYRPLAAIALLGACVALVFFVYRRKAAA